MAQRVPLQREDVTIGQPLPWTIFDRSGTLLLREGAVITDERMLERLLGRQALRDTPVAESRQKHKGRVAPESNARPVNPFESVGRFRARCAQVFQQLRTGEEGAVDKCLGLAADIGVLFDSAPDACIALVHLEWRQADSITHALCTSLLVHLLARRTEAGSSPALLAAALTANVSTLAYQERLNAQEGELSSEQLAMVRRHPEESVAILRGQGLDDRDWLQAVHQHHERSDGKGYPQGLRAEQIHSWARMIGMVDCYLAMVGKRGYHERKTPQQALRYFLECGSVHDQALSTLMIRALGVYPPGSSVRLANGEYAMVIKRNPAKPVCPEVRAVASADGAPYSVANLRDCAKQDFRIWQLVPRPPKLAVPVASLWGY